MPKKLPAPFLRLLQWMRRVIGAEPVMSIAVAACAFVFIFFAKFASEVMEGESHRFDEHILLMLRDRGDSQSPLGPPWAEEVMRDLTALGGNAVLTLVTLAVAAYLITVRRRGQAIYLLSAVGTGVVLSNLSKFGFDRPRPDLVPHGSITYTSSFPSGHSLMSAVVYLTLGAILAEAEPRRGLQIYLIGLAVVLVLLVGVSRVYLGVHWPSDVVGGWLMGAGWALLFWIIAKFLQDRHLLHKR